MQKGKVYLIGAGPGEVDLITVRGAKIISQADVIIYDYLVDRNCLKYAKADAEIICADELDKNRFSDGFAKRQDLINEFIIKKAKEGKRVVRLKNGDPFIFGRANEELTALLRENIEFAVIPGVTSATAAACFSGIPLTSRDSSSSVVFLTGHQATNRKLKWKHIAKIDTIVIYMGVENLKKIIKRLIKCGVNEDKPVAVISNATKFNQKTFISNLKNVLNSSFEFRPPAIIIIGDVVKKEKDFNWFRKSKKVLFTGLSDERFFEDGIIFHIPFIEILPLQDYSHLDKVIKKIEKFDWIVFVSRYGVYYFFERLFKLGFDARILNRIKIAAIGMSTANRLKEYGIIADLIPKIENSDGLVEELKRKVKNKSVLLLRSDIADKGLEEKLKRYAKNIVSVIAYRNVMPEKIPDIDLNFFDEIIFTSPSTVRNFYKTYDKIPERIKVKCIGKVTEAEFKKYRFNEQPDFI